MSMAMATCNTIGNSVATVVVAKWAGEFTEQNAREEYARVLGRAPGAALSAPAPSVAVMQFL
ncbi:C4-dicarboxylate transporter DctA [compost metagenome]